MIFQLTLHLGVAQLLMIALMCFVLGSGLYHNGKPRTEPINFYKHSTIYAIVIIVLWFGGFFYEFRWPQCIFAAVMLFDLIIAYLDHNKVPLTKHNFIEDIVSVFLVTWLLWAGGFFG